MNKLGSFILKALVPSCHVRSKTRVNLINRFGGDINQSAELRLGLNLDGFNISIGKNSFLNQNCSLYTGYDQAKITIGENVFIGMDVLLTCISHEIGYKNQRAGENTYGDITIEDGVWIGARAVVLPGVVLGKGCIIAAGSVVTKTTESNYLYAGVPAMKIKKLSI